MTNNPAIGSLYRHSGRFGALALAAPLVGFVAALGFGFVYAAANIHIPIFGVVTALVCTVYAVVVGAAMGLVFRAAHTRNHLLALALSFAGAVVSLYALWVTFIYMFLRNQDVDDVTFLALFLSPGVVGEIMGQIVDVGWFTVKGTTWRGLALQALWIVEALFFVGVALATSMSRLPEVYCEPCRAWCRSALQIVFDVGSGVADVVKRGSVHGVERIKRGESEWSAFERVNVAHCAQCAFRVANVESVSVSFDKEGKRKENAKPLLANTVVSPALVEALACPAPRPGSDETHVDDAAAAAFAAAAGGAPDPAAPSSDAHRASL